MSYFPEQPCILPDHLLERFNALIDVRNAEAEQFSVGGRQLAIAEWHLFVQSVLVTNAGFAAVVLKVTPAAVSPSRLIEVHIANTAKGIVVLFSESTWATTILMRLGQTRRRAASAEAGRLFFRSY